MGNLVVGMSPDDIAKIPKEEFKGAVENIAQVGGLSSAQLAAWAQKATEAYGAGDVSKISEADLQSLGRIAIGFSAEELGKLKLDSDETITAIGKHKGYSSNQVNSVMVFCVSRKYIIALYNAKLILYTIFWSTSLSLSLSFSLSPSLPLSLSLKVLEFSFVRISVRIVKIKISINYSVNGTELNNVCAMLIIYVNLLDADILRKQMS